MHVLASINGGSSAAPSGVDCMCMYGVMLVTTAWRGWSVSYTKASFQLALQHHAGQTTTHHYIISSSPHHDHTISHSATLTPCTQLKRISSTTPHLFCHITARSRSCGRGGSMRRGWMRGAWCAILASSLGSLMVILLHTLEEVGQVGVSTHSSTQTDDAVVC